MLRMIELFTFMGLSLSNKTWFACFLFVLRWSKMYFIHRNLFSEKYMFSKGIWAYSLYCKVDNVLNNLSEGMDKCLY